MFDVAMTGEGISRCATMKPYQEDPPFEDRLVRLCRRYLNERLDQRHYDEATGRDLPIRRNRERP
ncbi:MAG: hypothetical protein LBF93_09760, partial [Zoogloeaceae bacterium]|nr:hypothetical protein [Zoogloeaceae bacterium]